MIQRLGSDVVSDLRSGVALTSISQCVEELVLNSLDAASTCIAIDVDISRASVEVSDNGTGMRQGDLRCMGNRYFTSKCHNLRDLKNANSYGFRGEAVASLSKLCEKLEVISRHKTSYRTFCKLTRRGKDMGIYESTSPRSRHGTTVLAHGMFHALPVRRKLISSTLDLERIRRKVAAIAIMHPNVSLILRNKETGCTYLQTHRSLSVLSIISQVFGCYKSKSFKPITKTSGFFKLSGYINLEGYPNKNFQFFYINKRLVLKTKFHKLANRILSKGISQFQTDNLASVVQQGNLSSPKSKTGDKYAGFVINLECPHNAYDVTFDPAKTLVEFENWDDPLMCLTLCLNEFLVNEGILTEDISDDLGNCVSSDIQDDSENVESVEADTTNAILNCKNDNDPVCKKTSICPSNLKWSLYSATAKRKQNLETEIDERERKSSRNTPEDDPNQFNKEDSINKSCNHAGIENSSGSDDHCQVQSHFPVLSSAVEENAEPASSTVSLCLNLSAKIPSPQKPLKTQRCKKLSIYTVLQKYCHIPNSNSSCIRIANTEQKHSNKHSSTCRSECESSKVRCSQKTKLQLMGCGKVNKSSAMHSLRKRAFKPQHFLKTSKMTSLLRKEHTRGLMSKEDQIRLAMHKGGACSSIQKIRNCTGNSEHSPEGETYYENRVLSDFCQLEKFKQMNNQKMSSNPDGNYAKYGGTSIMNSETVNRGICCAGSEECQKDVNNLQTVVSPVIDSFRTAGDPGTVNCSTVGEPGNTNNFMTEDGCRVTDDSRTVDDSRTKDNSLISIDSRAVEEDSSELADVGLTCDFMALVGSESETVDDSRTLYCYRTSMVADSGTSGNSKSDIGGKQYISNNNESAGDVRGVSGKTTDQVDEKPTSPEQLNVDETPGRLSSREPDGEVKVGDGKVDFRHNGVRVINGDDNYDGTTSSHSEWICQYDPREGRHMYVNVRTGNTSLENPTHETDSSKVQSNSERSGQTQTLHPFASHLSYNFTPWLPRRKNQESKNGETPEGMLRKNHDEFQNGSSEIDAMFDSWVNPVFKGNGKTIVDASFPSASKNLVKVHAAVQPFNFTKECFKNMKVIRQLDKKFIICHYSGSGNRNDDLLVIVDQHAAHERVRLENFTKDLYSSSLDATKPARIKSSFLIPPCKIFFSNHEVGLMHAFRTQLEDMGITFEEELRSPDEHQQSVAIKSVPSLFLGRERSESESTLPTGVETIIEELIKEQIEILLSTKGASAVLPKSMVKTLNSQACHGAIRFGDVLSLEDCEDLIGSLSKCDLPFQCAHGRPSMIPLINVKLTQKEMPKKAVKLPQLWKIKRRMANEL